MGVQIIRAFRKDGITKVYNYTGCPLSGNPLLGLKRIDISPTLIKFVDKEKEKKPKK